MLLLAQLGILPLIWLLWVWEPQEAASNGIIGGADGPTAIFHTSKLALHLGTYCRGCLFVVHGGFGTRNSANREVINY